MTTPVAVPVAKQPQPVLSAAAITSAIKSVISILTLLGFNEAALHLSAMTTTIVAVAIGLYELLPHVLVALHIRSLVTPVVSPKTATGVPLKPASDIGAMAAAIGNSVSSSLANMKITVNPKALASAVTSTATTSVIDDGPDPEPDNDDADESPMDVVANKPGAPLVIPPADAPAPPTSPAAG